MSYPAPAFPSSKAERIYAQLRREIRDLTLPPGAQIHKQEVASAHRASKAPVNEAIARLAEEGLVEVRPQHASLVAPIRAEDVRESFFICSALELEGVRRAAASTDARRLQGLAARLAEQAAALAAGDLARFHDLDDELHAAIFMARTHPRLRRVLRTARIHLQRARRLAQPDLEWARALLAEHGAAIEAIATGDPAQAAAATRARLAETERVLERGARLANAVRSEEVG